MNTFRRPFEAGLRLLLVLVILAGTGAMASPSVLAGEPTPAAETASEDPTPTVVPPTPEPTAALPTAEPTATETAAATESPTAEPTVAETATTEPSPNATASASVSPSMTATPPPTPSPTATAESVVEASATTYTVKILSVDLAGSPIPWTCYDIRHDAGGGAPGSLIVNVCDWQDDGIIEVKLAIGTYVLVETRRPSDIGTASNKVLKVNGTRSITVKHPPLTTVIVTSTDAETGSPLLNACFSLEPLTPIIYPQDYRACDSSDGEQDGITRIGSVDRATYTLGEFDVPFGYFGADEREINITTTSSPFTITMPHERGAMLVVHSEDANGDPLIGGCFRLLENNNGTPGNQAWNDGCDRNFGPEDGDTPLVAFASGSYFLRQWSSPAGYLPALDTLVTLTVGETTEVTVTSPVGGTVIAKLVDDRGQPLNDVCYTVYRNANGTRGEQVFLPPCQGGASATDGVTTLIGLPPGNFLLVQGNVWPGYVISAAIPFSVTGSETQEIQIVNPVGGKLVITTVSTANSNQTLSDACFYVFRDAGDGARGAQASYGCDRHDGQNDGVTTISGFAAGSYVLAQSGAAVGFNVAADRTFTIALGETKAVTVADQPYGKVRIFKKTPENAPLPGACFVAIYGPGSQIPGNWASGTVCDDQNDGNDGTIEIALPNGNFLLHETAAPAGYVPADDVEISIADGATVEVTIVDPTPSSATLMFVDVWHDPVPGFCTYLHMSGSHVPPGTFNLCDNSDGADDGTLRINGLSKGDYEITVASAPPGYQMGEVAFSLGEMEAKTIEVVLTQAAPTITRGPFISDVEQTSVTIYWETSQKTIGTVEYGLTDDLGQSTSDDPAKQHRITLTGLDPDAIYAFTVTATNPNGGDGSDIGYFHTLSAFEAGRIVITNNDSSGKAIPGACFDVFANAGGGAPGAFVAGSCDLFEQDGANGKTAISGLVPGSYVLFQFSVPAPFKLAAPVAFTISRAGQTVARTVVNVRGGATLRAIATSNGGPAVIGACFSIFKDAGGGTFGAYVTAMCDDFDGAIDGLTTFNGLGAGKYLLWEYYVPDGYIRANAVPFEIVRGQREAEEHYQNWRPKDTSNILIRSINRNGEYVPGACYSLFRSDSTGYLQDFVADRCDSSDGQNDGLTYFTGTEAGTYAVIEYLAPPGYVTGKKTVITKLADKRLSKQVTQFTGGRSVTVTTVKGDTSTKVKGACYGLYRLVNNRWEFMISACDDWDGTVDGVTRLNGVPAGTYRLYQTSTPSGYKRAGYVSVTVSSTANKAVTVRTYPR